MSRSTWPLASVLVLALSTAACKNGDDDTSGDLDDLNPCASPDGCFYDTDVAIEEVEAECVEGGEDILITTVRLHTMGNDLTLDMVLLDDCWPGEPSSCYRESHTLDREELDEPCACWSTWKRYLYSQYGGGLIEPDLTTNLWCEDLVDSTAFMITASLDGATEPYTDCAIYGYQSEQYFVDHLGHDCSCVASDGDCTD